MLAKLRKIITAPRPEIPASVKPYIVSLLDPAKRDNVYYPLNQIMPNGNFENDFTGWSTGGNVNPTVDIAFAYNGSKSFKSSQVAQSAIVSKEIVANAGDKIYTSAYAYFTSSEGAYQVVGLLCDTGGYSNQVEMRVETPIPIGQWIRRSVIKTSPAGGVRVIVGTVNQMTRVVNIDAVMILNLTTIFGAGNEPSTAEVDEILLADGVSYWDGIRSVLCNPLIYRAFPQLVANGNFENGITGWTASNSTHSVSNGILTNVGDGSSASAYEYQTTAIPIVVGQKIYFKGKVRVTNGLATSIVVNIQGSTVPGTSGVIMTQNTPSVNAWYTFSAVVTVSADATGFVLLRFRTIYADAATQNGKVTEIDGNYSVICFNPTAIFGAGKELTALQMDNVLSANNITYFDGTQTLLCNPNGRYYWKDSSGKGCDAKIFNTANISGSRLSVFGLESDGTDDYARLVTNIDITNQLTVFAWVKITPQAAKVVISKYDTGLNKRSWLISSGSAGSENKMRVVVSPDGSTTQDVIKEYVSSRNVFDGNKHLIALTFSPNALRLYVDGALDVAPAKFSDGVVNAIYSSTVAVMLAGYMNNNVATVGASGIIGLCGICYKEFTPWEMNYLYQSTRKRFGV